MTNFTNFADLASFIAASRDNDDASRNYGAAFIEHSEMAKLSIVEAPEALALGLLNEVVPDVETLQRRADETAKLVAGHAPITLEVTKEAVRRIRRTLSRDEGEDLILRAYMSEDFREGMDAFLNKRAPNFKGK